MEKLPATSYVRMVDIWLIFVQLVPFIEVNLLAQPPCAVLLIWNNANHQVVLFTVIELYNEGDYINHHGFERSVAEFKEESKTSSSNNIFNIATFFGKQF